MYELVDKNDPEVQRLMYSYMTDIGLFAKSFFPHEVSSSFSLIHNKMLDVLNNTHDHKKAIPAPRGIGKTTLAKIKAVQAIVFRQTNFVIYLSNSEGSAEEATEHIKSMLIDNELLIKFFGMPQMSQRGIKEGFSKKSWVAYGDVYVLPRGSGQQIRGKNWMGHRPGLIIIDDLETLEGVASEDQREKLSNWFFADVMKTENRYDKPTDFIYIDTIKSQNSLMQLLVDSDDWIKPNTPTGTLSICDANLNTYDPNYMTTEEIRKEYEEHKAKGKADLFYMERMNIPISLEDAVFKQEYFKYFTEDAGRLVLEDGTIVKTKELITVIIVDPARTVKLQSAESAIVVTSIDLKNGRIFVRNVVNEHFEPDSLYDAIFENVLLFRARYLAVEVTGLCAFISQPIQNEMKKRGIFPTYIELNATGDKDQRISTLAPNYKLGYMYHNKACCTALENQLIWHPKSKLKDIIDALAYVNKIMEMQSLFFEPTDDEDWPNEFDEIEDDPIEDDLWRIA